MNYFSDCKTIEQANELRKELSKKLHPDKGGKTEDFQEMMNQFREFESNYLNDHFHSSSFSGLYKNIKIKVNENDEIEFVIPGIIRGQVKLLNNTDSDTSHQFDRIFNILLKTSWDLIKTLVKEGNVKITKDDEIEFFIPELIRGQCKILSSIGPEITKLVSYYLLLKNIKK